MRTDIRTNIETITPDEAQTILAATGTANWRKISNRHVARLVGMIKDGKFDLNGESIVLDEKGRCIDGQHRLMACVRAGIPSVELLKLGKAEAKTFPTLL